MVKLATKITRGTEVIEEVSLRKPLAGELRGTKMTSLLQMDVSSLLVLLPRITQPALLPNEVAALEPEDLFALGTEVVGFFHERGTGLGSANRDGRRVALIDDVEEAMADLAMVFHWSPRDMDQMSVEELARWHELARARANPEEQDG